MSQRTRNGDASDAQPCPDNPILLCNENGAALTARGGAKMGNLVNPGFFPGFDQFSDGGSYALLNETATDSNGYGATLQATYRAEPFGRPNQLLVGVSYDGGSTLLSARTSLGALGFDRGFIGPGVVLDQPDGSITPVRLGATNSYYGLYASDTLDVTDRLSLTLPGRLNVAEIDLHDQTGTALSGNHSFTRFNPAAGLTYKVAPWLTVYGGYSESNRTPTPLELSCASASSPCSLTNFFVADPSLKQVVGHTYEAGLRGRFTVGDAARVTWNAGLFQTDSDDDILFTASAVLGRGFFQNVGATRRQGVEAGVSLRQGSLLAYANYAYTEATFQSAFLLGSQDNPFADENGQVQVRPGNRLPGIPLHRLKFGLQYDLTPDWTVGTTGIASSGRVLQGDGSNQSPTTGSYVVLNLNTSYRVTKGTEMFGLVQNVTNEKYATFGGFSPVGLVPIAQASNTTNTRSITPGAPAAGYAGLRVTF